MALYSEQRAATSGMLLPAWYNSNSLYKIRPLILDKILPVPGSLNFGKLSRVSKFCYARDLD